MGRKRFSVLLIWVIVLVLLTVYTPSLYAAASPGNDVLESEAAYLPGSQISVDKSLLTFGGISTGPNVGPQIVRITSTGTDPLTITSITLGGTHAGRFIITPPALPVTLNNGLFIDVPVVYDPDAAQQGNNYATLNIVHDANTTLPATNVSTVDIRGLSYTVGDEPSLQEIFNVYAMPATLSGDDDPTTTPIHSSLGDTDPRGLELGIEVFQQANIAQPVTVEVLGVFAFDANPNPVSVGWYSAGNRLAKNLLFAIPTGSGRTLTPIINGSTSFNPAGAAFGMYSTYPAFYNGRNVFTEDALNKQEDDADGNVLADEPWTDDTWHHSRVYPYYNPDGTIEPNAYIIAYDESRFGNDYNDIVIVIRNVAPGALAPGGEIDFTNLDWAAPLANNYVQNIPELSYLNTWLSFNRIDFFTPRPYHDTVTLRIHNLHPTEDLTITSFSIDNPTEFILPNGETGPIIISPNGQYDLDVQFVRVPGPRGVYHSTLHISSSDLSEPVSDIHLAGIWQDQEGGQDEPFLEHIVEALGLGTNIGAPWDANGGIPFGINGNDVSIPGTDEIAPPTGAWQRLDPTAPIYGRHLASFAQGAGGIALVPITGGGMSTGSTPANNNDQTLFPRLGIGTPPPYAQVHRTVVQFPATTFAIVHASGWRTTNPYNCRQAGFIPPTAQCNMAPNLFNHGYRGVRMFALRNSAGQIVPGAYLAIQDFTPGNYDYQDNIALWFNIAPVITDTDLIVTGSVTPDPVAINNQATFIFRVRNITPVGVLDVTLDGTYPAGVTIDSITSSQGPPCTFGGGTYTCNLDNLSPAQEVTVTIVMTSATTGARTVTANVTDTDPLPDLDLTNNQTSVSTTYYDPSAPTSSITIIKDGIPNSVQTFNFTGTNGIGNFSLIDDGSSATPLYQYNFQPDTSAVPAPFTPDFGLPYSIGAGFGWSGDNSLNDRQNPAPLPPDNWIPQENLTYNHMQLNGTFIWMRDLPNGLYDVTISVGDTRFPGGHYVINVEGGNVIDYVPVGGPPTRIFTSTSRIFVNDGQLTVDSAGSTNPKIDYITISPLPPNQAGFAVFPGTYTITEDTAGLPATWSLSGVVCTGGSTTNVANGVQITVGSNQDVVCTFTNVDSNATLVAVDDFATTGIDTLVTIDVVANDTGIVPGTVIATSATLPGSILTNNGDGTFDYTPPLGFQGTDTFTYTGEDAGGATSNVATVTITVGGNPTANDDTSVTLMNNQVTIDVVANDTDPQGNGTIDPTTAAVVTGPASGNLVSNGDGTFTYTPVGGFTGTVTFTYTVEDVDGNLSNVATATIIVNDAPVAVDDNAATSTDTPVIINVVGNDTDTVGGINNASVFITNNPANGTAVDNGDGTVTYTPNLGFIGPTDSFTYTVSDIYGQASNEVTVTITFNNAPPVANDDSGTTDSGVLVNIDLTTNDTDADGTVDVTSLALGGTAPAAGNTVVFNADGTVDYTPAITFSGVDTFTYTVLDNNGAISNEATVTVTVNNLPPTANDDSATTDRNVAVIIDLTTNDTDTDGTIDITSLAAGATPAANGTVVFNADGTATYTPNAPFIGIDTFTYTVNDNSGNTSNEATVTVTVNNIPPVAVDDTATTTENTPVIIDLTTNDTDSDGTIDITSLALGGTAPAAGNTVLFNADGTVTYTPAAAFSGVDTFTYTVLDNNGAISNEATVTITVFGTAPGITVSITPATQQVLNGTDSTFNVTVTNISTLVGLDNVSVFNNNTLPFVSDCARGLGTLAASAVVNFTCTDTAITADYDKTITVSGDPQNAAPTVTDNDTVSVTVYVPQITVQVNPATQNVPLDGTAVFFITVTNTGPSPLQNAVVTDSDPTSDCEVDQTTQPGLALMNPGDAVNYTCTVANVTADFTNTVDVAAEDVASATPVTDSASADVVMLPPDITITITPAVQAVLGGNAAVFTITVTNTGVFDLENLVITDSDPTSDCEADGIRFPQLVTLAVGASFNYNCAVLNVAAPFTNTADVTSTPVGGGAAVTDSDSADVTMAVGNPSVTITVTANTPVVPYGGNADFTIVVVNNGDTQLNNVTVTTLNATACSINVGTLAAGAGQTYSCSELGVTAGFTNTADVIGTIAGGGGATVNATDNDSVQVAGLTITKDPVVQTVASGAPANFTITVENIGEVELNVTVTDPTVVACDNAIGLLAAGANQTYNCSQPSVVADFTNTATASGITTDGSNVTVTDDDSADVVVIVNAPSISVVITPATQTVLIGTAANFTITVTNNGNEQIDGVVVTNDIVAACDADQTTQVGLASIAVGANVSYNCSQPGVAANFTNTITANGTSNPGGTPVTDTDTADVTATGSLFDPPFGFKSVTDQGNNVLQWGFFWTNNGPAPVQMRVTDTIPAGLTYIPGSLTCTTKTGGSLTTTFCDVVGNDIIWEGTLQPEPVPGVTRLQDTVNPLIVTFRTQVPDGINSATNISRAEYDSDGDGTLESNANSNQVTWSRGGPTVGASGVAAAPNASVSNGVATIVKSASPPFAGTGESVTFTITISNNSNQPIAAVGLSDDVPAEFEILSASASYGAPIVNGQTVLVPPFFLGQGQSVTLTIETRIRDSVQAPFVLFNVACTTDVAETLCANTRVLSVSVLPQTGESPWSAWRPLIFLLAGLLTAFAAGWVIRRVRRSQIEH